MADKKDIVIGVADGHGWQQISSWALSLLESGFAGPCVFIVYDDDPDRAIVICMLQSVGFHVIGMSRRADLANDRFADISTVLGMLGRFLRYAIVADVGDVFFQSDPTMWLESNLTKPFLAVSEGIRYGDGIRAQSNLRNEFPVHADRMLSNMVCNVGILAGEATAIADLCLAISMVARSSAVSHADQSAYNVLLAMEPYRSTVQIVGQEDGFACRAGTLAEPRHDKGSRTRSMEPRPTIDADGVKTASGELFPIVHHASNRNMTLLRILATSRTTASRSP
ncbi:hypothetical protein ACLMAJ_26180 [Nocardia sp. KC 131]|uniref:hypothetical protein n=1 Tax=Nocardia arseniciresistens TaxID=3392119 RepID=UPI00398F7D9E